jgi:hypothetical protein
LLVLAGCGGSGSATSTETSSGAKPTAQGPIRRVIDETKGTYRGVGLGDTQATIVVAIGPPAAIDQSGGHLAPVGTTQSDFHPGSGQCYSSRAVFQRQVANAQRTKRSIPVEALRYRNSSFLLTGARACSVTIVEERAGTRRGVAIEDPLDKAKAAYPGIRCSRHTYENDAGINVIDFPYCAEMLAPSRYLWFGGDPIDTIELSSNPRY